MRILLVRHGQTDWNRPARAQGHSDIPLNETGRQQAAALGIRLADQTIDRVIASDLIRTQETARAVGHPFTTNPALRERSYGDWEGGEFVAVNQMIAEKAAAEGSDTLRVRPPNGESFADAWDRLLPIAEELCTSEGTTLVVSHGGAIAVLISQLIRGSLESVHAFHLANCALTEFERRPDGFVNLIHYNDPTLVA